MSATGRLKWLVFGEFEDEMDDLGLLARLAVAIRSSFLRFTIFLGLVWIVCGVILNLVVADQGTVAAMLVIWGVSAILYGLLGFIVVILIGY
jgi:hypothetical protein